MGKDTFLPCVDVAGDDDDEIGKIIYYVSVCQVSRHAQEAGEGERETKKGGKVRVLRQLSRSYLNTKLKYV